MTSVFVTCTDRYSSRDFANRLCQSLRDRGVICSNFLHINGDRGEDQVKLLIRRSRIYVPIFSESDWWGGREWISLKEVAYMVECKKQDRLYREKLILPIFLGTSPTKILDETRRFLQLLSDEAGEAAKQLREALREIENTPGWVLRSYQDRHSPDVEALIVQEILGILEPEPLYSADYLVGIERKIICLMNLLDVEVNDVRVIGIYGPDGIGKTTLAKSIYDRILSWYDGSSFLTDFQECAKTNVVGLKMLQMRLISDILDRECLKIDCPQEGVRYMQQAFCGKRVLIVLDDVDSADFNLEVFLGNVTVFGPGSRIIITSTAQSMTALHGVTETYHVEEFCYWEALQLFTRHAFRGTYDSLGDYLVLMKGIVSVLGRLPLGIEVISSYLFGKPVSVWRDTLKILEEAVFDEQQKNPLAMNHKPGLRRILSISHAALEPQQKQIFTDIAWFLHGKDGQIASCMWHDIKGVPSEGVYGLVSLSLVKIGERNELLMHSELRQLGMQFLSRDQNKYGNLSGLWVEDLSNSPARTAQWNSPTERDVLYNISSKESQLQDLKNHQMERVRFHRFDDANFAIDLNNSYLPDLRWVEFEKCPQTFGAVPTQLVIIDLSWSNVTHNWEGWRHIKMVNTLKVLNLTGCADLIVTPDLGEMNLEKLIFERCIHLVRIDPSICHLKKLTSLNLKFCCEVSSLPNELGFMEALKELLIDGTSIKDIPLSIGSIKTLQTLSASNCLSLSRLPHSVGYLTSLLVLSLVAACITELPSSIEKLGQLKKLSLRNCQWLGELPDSIGGLKDSLVELDVSGTGISEFPDSIGHLQRLRVLKAESCFITEFPEAILKLSNLEEIHAAGCRNLESLITDYGSAPELGRLKSLRILRLRNSSITSLPLSFCELPCLETLDLYQCNKLKVVSTLPISLTSLRITSSKGFKGVGMVESLANLKELLLGDCSLEEQNRSFMEGGSAEDKMELTVYVQKLETLDLRLSLITSIRFQGLLDTNVESTSLTKLVVSCMRLQQLPNLPPTLVSITIQHCWSLQIVDTRDVPALQELQIHHCALLREIKSLHVPKGLRILEISHCRRLVKVDGSWGLQSLRRLSLSRCKKLKKLPDLRGLKMLRSLEIHHCRIVKLDGLEFLGSLQTLCVSRVDSIKRLPDLSRGMKELKYVDIRDCKKLPNIQDVQVFKNWERSSRTNSRSSVFSKDSTSEALEYSSSSHYLNSTLEKYPPGSPSRGLASPRHSPQSPRVPVSPKLSKLGSIHLTINQVVKATKNFSPKMMIGKGAFGIVYKGQLDDGRVIVIKRVKQDQFGVQRNQFDREVELLFKIDHLNLVKLLGYIDIGEECLILTEFVRNGTLRAHLDGRRGQILDFNQRLGVAIDVAHGLTYLHLYSEKQIIHGEVNSSNIILTESMRAKVADFGFARLGDDEDSDDQLTAKSDVYSFGVLLFEILTGGRPIEPIKEWAFEKFKQGQVAELVDSRMEEVVDPDILTSFFELAVSCVANTPADRPNMKTVAELLWGIRADSLKRALRKERPVPMRRDSQVQVTSVRTKPDLIRSIRKLIFGIDIS